MELVGSGWQACVFQGEFTASHTSVQRLENKAVGTGTDRWKKTGMSNRLPQSVEESSKFIDTVLTLFKVSIEATCPSHERNLAFPADLLKVSWRVVQGFETKGKIS